jgi:hypothetical protein
MRRCNFQRAGQAIVQVTASVSGQSVDITPKYMLLCAGEGNLDLLRTIGAAGDRIHTDQLVQGPSKEPHAGPARAESAPIDRGLSAGGRALRGYSSARVRTPNRDGYAWLVSDPNSAPYSPGTGEPGLSSPEPDAVWVRNMVASLRTVHPPPVQRHRAGLEAALYTGLTSERDFVDSMHRADFYGDTLGFRNLATIWPTKLTLTAGQQRGSTNGAQRGAPAIRAV